jgi:hypothetical protein
LIAGDVQLGSGCSLAHSRGQRRSQCAGRNPLQKSSATGSHHGSLPYSKILKIESVKTKAAFAK